MAGMHPLLLFDARLPFLKVSGDLKGDVWFVKQICAILCIRALLIWVIGAQVSYGFQITENEKKLFAYCLLISETKEKKICTFYKKEDHNSAADSAANFTSLLAHSKRVRP